MFYIGGNAGCSNIEVHDIQFVAVKKIEDAYPILRSKWFGDPDKIHLDGYQPITWVDGFDISLHPNPHHNENKLFFVNVGGYLADQIAEQHAFSLFVAKTASEAKEKALNSLLIGYDLQHKDNLKDVDNCLQLSCIDNMYIHLHPNSLGELDKIEWQGYRPIGIEI